MSSPCFQTATFFNFDEMVISNSFLKLVILDISAEWCSPCRALEPILSKVASSYPNDEVLFCKLEAEDVNMKIAGSLSVRGFPTVIAFKNGIEVDRFHSTQTEDFIFNFINNCI
ncbi:thioredoxin domain-containing protein [Gammaproteobacteria bacterium]|nr:thioredoxin domain-containing protein [Gammaproteobacteria bacterium]